jgi:malonyl-CoA O-methyltransferase
MNNIKNAFNKAAKNYNKHAILQQEVANRLFFNLKLIKNPFETIVDLGAGTGFLSHLLVDEFVDSKVIALDFAQNSLKINQQKTPVVICADATKLPFASNSVDVIVSNLMMQWCQDLPTLFAECYRVLKPNGTFMFSTFGVDTLKELKQSWGDIDNTQHINEFIDMHTIGDALLGQSFKDPVMTMEMFTLTYETVNDLMLDLKGIGASTLKSNNHKGLTGKDKFKKMRINYEKLRQDSKLPASYEVIYGHAFKTNTSFIMEEK